MSYYFFLPLSGACVSAEPDTFRVSAGVSFPVFSPLLAMELMLFDVFSFLAMPRNLSVMVQKMNGEASVAERMWTLKGVLMRMPGVGG